LTSFATAVDVTLRRPPLEAFLPPTNERSMSAAVPNGVRAAKGSATDATAARSDDANVL
jgi:hypothetical protein